MSSTNDMQCFICKRVYFKPVTLPCGLNICTRHQVYDYIKCSNCDGIHSKPCEEFPDNEEANELSLKYFNELYIGKINESMTSYQSLINESEAMLNDPQLYIYDYFSDLRNKADLAKEQLIQLIEQRHEKYIDQLKELERNCKPDHSKINSKFSEVLKVSKNRLNSLNETIKTTNLTIFKNIRNLSDSIKEETQHMDYLAAKFKNELLQNKSCTFKSSLNIDYDLQINDLNSGDKAAIEFTIDDFETFSQSNQNREAKEWKVANDVYCKISDVYSVWDYFECTLYFDIALAYDRGRKLDRVERFVQIDKVNSDGRKGLLCKKNKTDKNLPVVGQRTYNHHSIVYEDEGDFKHRKVDKLTIKVDISAFDLI